jgi:hypothetical protein
MERTVKVARTIHLVLERGACGGCLVCPTDAPGTESSDPRKQGKPTSCETLHRLIPYGQRTRSSPQPAAALPQPSRSPRSPRCARRVVPPPREAAHRRTITRPRHRHPGRRRRVGSTARNSMGQTRGNVSGPTNLLHVGWREPTAPAPSNDLSRSTTTSGEPPFSTASSTRASVTESRSTDSSFNRGGFPRA